MDKWPKTGACLLVGDLEESFKLARQYTRKLLCGSDHKGTNLLDAGSHPDFKLIEQLGTVSSAETKSSKSMSIKIDQIRELLEWLSGTPQIASQKIAIIYPAHSMNVQAANALLKTLEEPFGDALIILVTDRPSALPLTVRSRCYQLRLPSASLPLTPPLELQEDLQALANRKEDPITIAARWLKKDPKQVLYWVSLILGNTLQLNAKEGVIIRDRKWWDFLDQVYESRRRLEEGTSSPNVQLLLETLLIEYTYVC